MRVILWQRVTLQRLRSTPRRATASMDLVHIDIAGPSPGSLEDSRFVVRVASTASLRYQGQEHARQSCHGEAIRGRYGHPPRLSGGKRYRVHESDVHLMLRRSWNSPRPYMLQQNGPVESALGKTTKAWLSRRVLRWTSSSGTSITGE